MKVPQLKKKLEIKTCHNIDWEDNYSWIHQKDILEVLKDKSKLNPEVKKYLENENAYTEHHLKDTKDIQKKLFNEIKEKVDEMNLRFSSPEQVKKFTILPRDFSIDDGELTPTLKIRRKIINENWAEEIEKMYSS